MNILVCLKMVSRATYTDMLCADDASDDRLSGGAIEINPADAYALETALKLKDRYGAYVTVLSMSPMLAEPMLRRALAMGADEAVLVCDRIFAGSDTIATAKTLSAALKALPRQDMIFCGSKAIDSETGHIGAQLAALNELRYMGDVLAVNELRGGRLCVKHAGKHGAEEYSLVLPAVFSIINGTGMIRSPTIFGLRSSAKREIRIMTGDTLHLTAEQAGKNASGTETVRIDRLSFAHRHGAYTDDVHDGAAGLAEMLECAK